VGERVKALLTALSFHKSKATLEPGPFVIAIVHDAQVPKKVVSAAKAAFNENRKTKVGSKSIAALDVRFRDKDSFRKALLKAGADAVYITPGSRSVTRQILNVTRSLKILSIAAVADFVHGLGASLGVEARAGRPKLLINLSGCKNEGIEFDPRLVRLASVFF
jgi:hypothetical protein